MLSAAIVTVTHRVLAPIDLVIIGIYFAIIFGIGFYFAKKGRTSEDYFLAGRNIGWFAIGASLFVSIPEVAPEPARPMKCSVEILETKSDAPMANQPIFLPARK